MTAVYRTCSPKRIASPALVARSLEARIVYIHLLVGEVAGQVPGLVRVGVLGLAEETGLEPADIRSALGELADHGLVEVDEATRVIRLPGVPGDHSRLAANPKTVTGWVRAMEDLPTSPLRARHADEMREVCPPDLRSVWAGLATQPDGNALPIDRQPNQGTGVGTRSGTRLNSDDTHAFAENPSPASAQPDDTPGPRLKLTRERHAWRLDLAATRSGIARGTLDKIERGSLQPTRAELAALAAAYGDPELATLQAVDGDNGVTVAERVVHELHRHKVELGLAQGDLAPVLAADVRMVWEPAEGDRAAGRGLLETWLTVIPRAAEEIRRERVRAKGGRSAEFFRLDDKGGLGGAGRRAKYIAAADLDRREDLTPQARGSPGRRGPKPPQNDNPFDPEIRNA